MSDITLSKGVRQNLLALQNVASLMASTQEKLATGKKVNSALDNPINFFTAAGLSARAGDLSRLLDSIGNSIQTVQAADKGISSITKLIENAQATARQALQAPAATSTFELSLASTVDIGTDDAAEVTITDYFQGADPDWSGLENETVTVTIGDDSFTYTFTDATTGQRADLAAFLDGIDGISATQNGDDLDIVADDNTTSFTIAVSAAGVTTDTGLANATYDPTNTFVDGLNGTLTFQLGSGTVHAVDFDEITNRGELEARLAEISSALAGVTIAVVEDNGDFVIQIDSTSSEALTIGQSDDAADDLGLAVGVQTPTENVTPNAARASLQGDYNLLMQQITQMARDASFNGVNLINGDNLTVTFNEDGSSSLLIEGVDFTAAGLGLTDATGDDFQTNASIQNFLNDLDTATGTLRAQAARFGSNLSIVQARQDFTNNMINVLQIGADDLVLADTNEEGANMLALNTRQQLSTVALSLASQADQNVLRLF